MQTTHRKCRILELKQLIKIAQTRKKRVCALYHLITWLFIVLCCPSHSQRCVFVFQMKEYLADPSKFAAAAAAAAPAAAAEEKKEEAKVRTSKLH